MHARVSADLIVSTENGDLFQIGVHEAVSPTTQSSALKVKDLMKRMCMRQICRRCAYRIESFTAVESNICRRCADGIIATAGPRSAPVELADERNADTDTCRLFRLLSTMTKIQKHISSSEFDPLEIALPSGVHAVSLSATRMLQVCFMLSFVLCLSYYILNISLYLLCHHVYCIESCHIISRSERSGFISWRLFCQS